MANVKVKQTTSSQFKLVSIIAIFAAIILFVVGKIKNNNIESNSKIIESIFSKEKNLRSIEDWEKIADYRAKEFYECTKDLDMDITKWYLFESCATSYNNNWVFFRDGLDEGSNLNYDQREMLKDYWHKTRDAMKEKVSNKMKENDKKLRPNRDN